MTRRSPGAPRRSSTREMARIQPVIEQYRKKLAGKRAAIYVGGAYKAVAIIRQLKELGMEIVLTGTQTGKKEEYDEHQRDA